MGEGGSKYPKISVTSFMDSPSALSPIKPVTFPDAQKERLYFNAVYYGRISLFHLSTVIFSSFPLP